MKLGLVTYILYAALRDRLMLLALIGAALASSMGIFLGSSAIIEQDQFSIVFAASLLRLFGVCGLVLFCVFFIRRSFETKDIEFLLARPVSRFGFLLCYSAGFSLLAVMFALLLSAVLWANAFSDLSPSAFSLWVLSLIVEYVIIIHAALFFSFIITSTTGATMAVFGFYILGRMNGHLLGIVDSGKTIETHVNEIMEFTLQVVSVLTPRLDLMAQSSWLVYGQITNVTMPFVVLQGVFFVGILLCATFIDLKRKQF